MTDPEYQALWRHYATLAGASFVILVGILGYIAMVLSELLEVLKTK